MLYKAFWDDIPQFVLIIMKEKALKYFNDFNQIKTLMLAFCIFCAHLCRAFQRLTLHAAPRTVYPLLRLLPNPSMNCYFSQTIRLSSPSELKYVDRTHWKGTRGWITQISDVYLMPALVCHPGDVNARGLVPG